MNQPRESLGDSREQTGIDLAAVSVASPAGDRRGDIGSHGSKNADFPPCAADARFHPYTGSTGSQPDSEAAAATDRLRANAALPAAAGAGPEFLAGFKVTGGSAPGPGQSRETVSQTVPATSDAALPAAQADHGGREGADGVGCGVPGDPAPAFITGSLNHPAIQPRHQQETTPKPSQCRRLLQWQIDAGALSLARLETVIAWREREENHGKPWKLITKATGVSSVEFCRWRKRIAAAGLSLEVSDRSLLIAALAKLTPPGRPPKHSFTEAEAATIAGHNLQSNRTETAGSPQEALRHAVKQGQVRPELAAVLAQRESDGKPLLTESMRRSVQVAETTVRAYRAPRNAWLENVQSPGSLQLTVDEATGAERMIEPGEAQTMDDATINLPLCVDMEERASQCWQNFGVVVGRFQFILPVDHSSYFITGFSFTARPRSSYRAEDLTATMQITMMEHGMPRRMFLEQGISKSKLVHETLRKLGIACQHVKSPHQKVVEGIFNKLWTKLSFLPGQVGRHMGDDEETTKLLMRCRAGQADPRQHFLMLGDVVKALREVIEDHNSGWVTGSRYGRWIPRDFWNAKAPAHLRPLDAGSAWMFSPVVTEPLTVRGFTVRTTVRLMDGMSQVFHFSAQWLGEFSRAKVKLFFNPFLDAPAKVVLAEDFRGFKAEAILGDAEMIDRHARFNLRKLGYGAFPDIGLAAARQNAQALRRSVVAIRPDGKPGITAHEARSMPAAAISTANTAPAPASDFLRRARGLGVSEDQFERQAARLARSTRPAGTISPSMVDAE